MNLLSLCTAAVLGCVASSAATAQDPGGDKQGGIPTCEDMKTTLSGLQWGVLQKGGDELPPDANDEVEVHYTGWLTDGTVFDSSRTRGAPTKFPVGRVIPGWIEGIQLMTPGMRCKFIIPGNLAYGERGSPPKIGANATLVFDVELLSVIRMPNLQKADPDKQKTLANGIKVETVKVGTGAQIGEGDGVAFRFAYWKPDGTLLGCTEQRGQKIGGTLDSLPLDFLEDVVAACKVGDTLRFEVPKAVWAGAGDDTVWELELLSVTQLPQFRLPEQAKVVKTQTGLEYEVISQGDGDSPKRTDTVSVHYTGWLTDGKVFDSSYARGEPAEFPVGGVIPGWTEGLQLMKPGAKFLLSIPSELAYGAAGRPGIPPNSRLVFMVELLAVK